MNKTARYLYWDQWFGNCICLLLSDELVGRQLLIWVWQKGWTVHVTEWVLVSWMHEHIHLLLQLLTVQLLAVKLFTVQLLPLQLLAVKLLTVRLLKVQLLTVYLLTMQLNEQIQSLKDTLVHYTPSWKLHYLVCNRMCMCKYCYFWANTSDSLHDVPPECASDDVPVSIIWKANGLSCDTYLMLQTSLFPKKPFKTISQPKCCIHSLYSKSP